MPFGYSRKIFKYPSVQYIPLKRSNEKIINSERVNNKVKFYLYNYPEKKRLLKKLNFLQFHDDYSIYEDQLVILTANNLINLIQYRGYEIIMVCNPEPGKHQLFSITKSYFYKDRLIFILYDGLSGEKLDFARYEAGQNS